MFGFFLGFIFVFLFNNSVSYVTVFPTTSILDPLGQKQNRLQVVKIHKFIG